MATELITDDQIFTEIVGDFSLACDFAESWPDCQHGEVQWVAMRVRCVCGSQGGARLICTGCKDLLMLSSDAIECVQCGEVYQPARTIVSSIEPLERRR